SSPHCHHAVHLDPHPFPTRRSSDLVSRPEGTDVEAYQVKQHAIQEICNKQQFGAGDRHYLGVQWTLWDGQLVITMLITVTVLHRSEEHTSELQSRENLVCRLLLEKK